MEDDFRGYMYIMYDEMKKFFRQEHLDLEKVNALTKQETSLNHAVFMSQQEKLIEQMKARLKANLVKAIGDFAAAYEEDSASNEDNNDKENTPPDLVLALSTITGNSNKQMEQMMKMFKGMCKKVDTLTKNNNAQSDGNKKTSILAQDVRGAAIAGPMGAAIIGATSVPRGNPGTSSTPPSKTAWESAPMVLWEHDS